uniref:NADH dehydrogenase subunit 6 n=1 Tax=Dipetalonema gracile TaxID=221945 RepID=UPI0021823B24|nr:NADH dehydrogenase subunit 6 [Dipetalonema gracile]UVN17309.1 NADH dehydrogenase subunit 6 [Dipetalonema gracile]
MFVYFSFFLSFLFFCFSFLDWDPLKSCVMMCFGVLFMSCYVSLGLHVWYSYFIVLIFLSGIFSLLTYFCSICNFVSFYSYYYWFFMVILVFLFLFFFDFDFCFFLLDFNFFVIYYDFSYYCVFWIVFVLFLLLNLLSFVFCQAVFMRGL